MILGARGDLVGGRYRLQSFLGEGGYGEVWKALDTHRNHEVALKLIKSRDRGATWHEARLLTALKSEHILEVNNADVAVDVPYLDTALARCSLDKECEPFGVEAGRAIDWMRRALRGLDLCHRRGLLHRDVKPQNVFLSMAGDAKLGDFGVAAIMDADGTADADGDPRIRAPELYGGGRASVASDIYAAACTLYALLSGHLPFEGMSTMPELERAIVAGACADLRDAAPHVSLALADRVRVGMSVDPDARFATAADFDSALSLPVRSRTFTPLDAAHTGHARCWEAAGAGGVLHVCVLGANSAGQHPIETRHAASGNRVTKHCLTARPRDLARRLRSIFNDLR